MKFKVGDRVRIKIGAAGMGIPHTSYMSRFEGNTGVVRALSSRGNACCVEIDGIPNHKWWWQARALEPVAETVCITKPTWRIIIEGDENTSRAKYIVGKKVIKEVSAKRYHKDKNDPAMAARALIGKMFPDTESAEPEPPKYFNGRVVCVWRMSGMNLTVGKIYEVKNGKLKKDNGIEWPVLDEHRIKSVEQQNDKFGEYFKFIEIKE